MTQDQTLIKIVNHDINIETGLNLKCDKKSRKKVKSSSKIQFSSIYNSQKYKYIVTSGNNSRLIREAMRRRPWWVEIPNYSSIFNFKWQPTSRGMRFSEMISDGKSHLNPENL